MAARHTRSQEGNVEISMNVKVSTAKRRRANSDTARSIKLAAGKTAGLRITKKLAKTRPKKRRRRVLRPVPRTYHPGPLIDGEATLATGVAALLAQDPETIGHMLEIGGPTPLRRREPGFEGLAAIIVSQQVSTASANAIFGRLRSMVAPLTAPNLRDASDDALRAAGLSAPKIRTLRALADAIVTNALDIDALASMNAEEAHEKLVAVKGIGPWTADIFLLVCLAHPDASPAGELALPDAARLALNLKKHPDPTPVEKMGEHWRP